jgi:hypothetical protein
MFAMKIRRIKTEAARTQEKCTKRGDYPSVLKMEAICYSETSTIHGVIEQVSTDGLTCIPELLRSDPQISQIHQAISITATPDPG